MVTDVQQPNFYKALGVSFNATQTEINRAYQKIIHRLDSEQAQASPQNMVSIRDKIAQVQEAYDHLSNREKRETYNKMIRVRLKKREALRGTYRTQEQLVLFREQEEKNKPKRRHNVYQDYYGFSEKPFDLTPDPKYLYLSPKHKEVLAHLVYGLEENNGFLKIVGEVGTGKTTICRSFLREMHSDFTIAYVFNPCIDDLELLQTINAELGLPSETSSRKHLTDILNHFLLEERKKGHRVVVIIDEAQDLKPEVLEQLRLLSNLETETEKLIQIVLIGQPELNKLLATEGLRQLRQRITIQWELLPLNLEETRGYIQHRLNVALGKGKVHFTRAGTELIYRYSHGTPRMINVLSDRSLLIAFTKDSKKINTQIVRLAVKDVGGLKPISSWTDTLLYKVIPASVAAGLLIFGANNYLLPDLVTDPNTATNIKTLINDNPMHVMDPGELIPQNNFSGIPDMKNFGSIDSAPEEIQIIENTIFPSAEDAAVIPAQQFATDPDAVFISQPEKLVTYLSSLSLMESKREAYKWLLQSWGLEINNLIGLDESVLENLELEFELLQYELNANFERLASLNYPAALEIALPNAQGTKYLSLISIQGERGIFGSVDRIEMPLSTIENLWTRKAIILWKDFEGLPENFESGFRGKEAVWLQKNLRLLGFFKGMEAPIYGGKTQRAVMKFQRMNQIKDDGKFHTDSKLLLYSLLDIYPTPKLLMP